LMRQIDQRYGSLDWRLPESHALYWAHDGLQSKGEHGLLDRIIYQCLSISFFSGNLDFDAELGTYARSPATQLLPGVLLAYETAMERESADAVRSAFSGFLKAAIPELERQDMSAEAGHLVTQLRELIATGD